MKKKKIMMMMMMMVKDHKKFSQHQGTYPQQACQLLQLSFLHGRLRRLRLVMRQCGGSSKDEKVTLSQGKYRQKVHS